MLAVVAIGVFGKVPDPSSIIAVEEIAFLDRSRQEEDFECERNEDGEKIIYIERGKNKYQLNWRLNPDDATDKKVSFVVLSGAEFVEIDSDGEITFFKEVSITVKIISNLKDKKEDIVIIEFIGNPSSGEENPF